MIKIGSIFKSPKFQSLSDGAKLLYIYLATHPQLYSVGLVYINLDVVALELGKTRDGVRDATIELEQAYLIMAEKQSEGTYFVVLGHYDTLPKSEATVKKALRELSLIPVGLADSIRNRIDVSTKGLPIFTEPTEQEVTDYAISQGYLVEAKTFIEYYRRQAEIYNKPSWCDSRGKPIRDWKSKMRHVWFKESNKLIAGVNAPEGFEYFYTMYDGKMIPAVTWRNNLPYSAEGFTFDKLLQSEYAKRQG